MTGVKPKVWATLLTKPSYLAGALVLHRTIRSVSKYPLVIMATPTLPESSRAVLRDVGMQIVEVDYLQPAAGQHPGFEDKFKRFGDTWTKLAVFGLTDFERIIMVDSDMLFLRPMDELFDLELPGDDWIAAAPACVCNPLKIPTYPTDWIPANCAITKQSRYETLDAPIIPERGGPRTSHLLNSGLVILQPSKTTYDTFVDMLLNSPKIASVKFADQDVMAGAFQGRWKPLPWWTNALKPLRACHADTWSDEEVRNIHYILDKPWDKRPSDIPASADIPPSNASPTDLPASLLKLVRNTGPQRSATQYDEVHLWWWVAYVAMVGELTAAGNERVWQEAAKWIDA